MRRSRGGFDRYDRDGLRKAILDADALVPMLRADPERAGQLLRAAVLDPLARTPDDPMDEDGSLEVTQAPGWRGVVPERGPFLPFLDIAPEVALPMFIEIVERATNRWADATERDVRDTGFEVVLDREPVKLIGDAGVLHWHRGEGRVSTVLMTILAAIEAWLYRRLDAGENIDGELARLLASRSAALWGVATEMAAYRPSLLRQTLAPLITSGELLIADRLYRRAQPHNHQLFAAIGEHTFGERIRTWHLMPHRNRAVFESLMTDVLTGTALVDELAEARARWIACGDDRLKHLLAQTDVRNLAARQVEGGVGWEYVPPAEMQQEVVESNEQMQASRLWLMGPYRFRDAIDKKVPLDDTELDGLLALVAGPLADDMPDELAMGGIRSRIDAEAGLAAVFVLCGSDWLGRNPDAQLWCRERLVAPFSDPPPTHQLDDESSVDTDRWDAFCADALPTLWAASPEDEELRSAIARLAVHRHRSTVRRLMARVSELPTLEHELRRLEHLALIWSRWLVYHHERRHRDELAQQPWVKNPPKADDLPDVETPTRQALRAFETGELSSKSPRLADWIAATPEGLVRTRGRRNRALMILNPDYLLAAFDHLLVLLPELRPEELERRLQFAEDVGGLIAEGMQPDEDDDGKVRGTPYEHERTALDRLGAFVVLAPRDRAAAIWRPLLAPGVAANYWVEDFLQSVWGALQAVPVQDAAVLVTEMIVFAEQSAAWTRRAAHRTDIALALVGLDRYGWGRHPDDTLAAIVTVAREPWARWVSAQVGDSWFTERILRFIGTPPAESVMEPVLLRLAELESGGPNHRRSTYDDALGDMLAQLMGRRPELFTAPSGVGPALRLLLSRLAERGSTLGLELVARLS